MISTLLSLQANVPHYVIRHYLGAAAVGTFAVMAYPFLLGNIAVTAMGQAASPQFADALRRGDGAAFRRVLMLTTAGGARTRRVGSGGDVDGRSTTRRRPLCPRYAQHNVLLIVLAAAAAVRYAYLPVGVAATAMRRIGIQLWVRVATIVAVTALVAAGVVWRGLDGAAIRASLHRHCRGPGLAGHRLRQHSRRAVCGTASRRDGLLGMCGIFGYLTPRRAIDPPSARRPLAR